MWYSRILFIFVFYFCMSMGLCAEENNAHLRILFSAGSIPTITALKPHQKWNCTEGVFYIFEMLPENITAQTHSGQVNFLIASNSLKQIAKKKWDLTNFIRVRAETGDLIIEQTLPDEDFYHLYPESIAVPDARNVGYIVCPIQQVSPISKKARALVQSAFSLPNLTVAISEKEIATYQHQFLQKQNEDAFEQALYRAFKSWLSDATDAESFLQNVPNREQWMTVLNQRDAVLTLLPSTEIAPRGERPTQNWIFVLSIPTLSDHQFFAVVNTVKQTVYNYGFN